METVLKVCAEQNAFFDPKDRLSLLIHDTLASVETDELGDEDLSSVQAARGEVHHPDGPKDFSFGE